jgi:6-phosphogluconolactonase (cycloisomerase 2 family)
MWNQQVQAIAGNVSGGGLGYTVALSADGKTLAATALYSNNYTGYVVVYTMDKDGGNMTQLGQTIYGNATLDWFGDSVDISSDGTFLAIGSPGDIYNFDRPGYVQVYTLETSDGLGYMWKQLGQTITGEGDGDNFGGSVSLSGDGKTLAVGAEDNDGFAEDAGRVKIYHLDDDGTSWKQLGQDIDGESATDRSGYSVSLSADGTTVVIGAPYSHNYGDYSGLVRVYRIDTGRSTWEKLGETIFGSVEDVFGQSVDISSDGNILAIGGDGGYVGVYKLENSSSWKQLGQNINGEAVDDSFGQSVSLSEDGKTLAVGAWRNDGNGDASGHVRVYRIDDSGLNWTQIGEDIDGEAACDYSGWSVSLSADGKTVAIGSEGADDNGLDDSGHVRVFVRE